MELITHIARLKKAATKKVLLGADRLLQTDYYWRYSMTVNGYHISNYNFEKNQIAFVHMPKTGGTSFRKLLNGRDDSKFVNITIHRPISLHCPPENYKYVTIVRDPIDRVWSYYQMVLRNPEGYPYREFAIKGLDCFLGKCWAASDMACQYYSGMVYHKVEETLYEKALHNLSNFYAVLSFKNFNTEVNQFFDDNNIQVAQIPHERKSSYSKPTVEERELIRSYNTFDIKLYDHWNKNNT